MGKTLAAVALAGATMLGFAAPALAATPATEATPQASANHWNQCGWQYNWRWHRWVWDCNQHGWGWEQHGRGWNDHDRDDHGRWGR